MTKVMVTFNFTAWHAAERTNKNLSEYIQVWSTFEKRQLCVQSKLAKSMHTTSEIIYLDRELA